MSWWQQDRHLLEPGSREVAGSARCFGTHVGAEFDGRRLEGLTARGHVAPENRRQAEGFAPIRQYREARPTKTGL